MDPSVHVVGWRAHLSGLELGWLPVEGIVPQPDWLLTAPWIKLLAPMENTMPRAVRFIDYIRRHAPPTPVFLWGINGNKHVP
eukprot:2667800-Amphidinium_carterae.1